MRAKDQASEGPADAPVRRGGTRRRQGRRLCTERDARIAQATIPPCSEANRRPVPEWLWTLHVAYHERREPATLDALVEEYTSYALACAQRFDRHGEHREDLAQVALEALVRALQRFDPGRCLPFPALATPTIEGALKRHFRDRGYQLRLPRRVQEATALVTWGQDRLRGDLGRDPSVQEVAAFLHLDVEEILQVEEALHARRLACFEELAAEGPDEQRAAAALTRAEERVAFSQMLHLLSDREREILHRYYWEEESQAAIARRYGVSQMQVSRWLAAIVNRLRSHAR